MSELETFNFEHEMDMQLSKNSCNSLDASEKFERYRTSFNTGSNKGVRISSVRSGIFIFFKVSIFHRDVKVYLFI